MESKNRSRNQRKINRNLFNAVEDYNLQGVEDCLKNGADVNFKENGLTSLHYAVEENNVQIVKVLINSGADINLLNNDGRTALVLAKFLSNTDPEIVTLLANAQSLQIPNSDHKTQLEPADPYSNKRNFGGDILKMDYSPDKHDLWDAVKSNQNVRVLEIDSRKVCPDFLNHNSFYSGIKNAENLFFVDVATGEGKLVLNEEAIKDKLKNIEKRLIIQCRSLASTTVYSCECSAKGPEILDLNVSPSEQFNEEKLIEKLSGKDSFGLSLLMEAVKSGFVGTFNNDPTTCRDLRSITFDVNKHFHSWRIIDYAVYYDHFLLTRVLSLHDWDLRKRNEAMIRTLEIAAEYASVDTLAALLDLQLPLPEGKISISKNIVDLLELADMEGYTPLVIAAKNKKQENVDFFIRCGAIVNHRNKAGKSAADLAWEKCDYDTVVTLVKADSDFPNGVKFDEENESTQKLKTFCEDRKILHTSIQEGNIEAVKKFLSINRISEFYINCQNQSALSTAIKAQQYDMYAFLKSVGAKFKSDQEDKCFDSLTNIQKNELKDGMVRYFSPIENAHILYLVSRSKSLGIVGNFKEVIESLYQELNAVPEISLILKVIQYCDYVDIIFDFSNESTIDVDPTSSRNTRGQCDYKKGRLYIGANVNRAELLGTLAHELTHFAMQIKYNNDCNPYEKSECEKIFQFEGIIKTVKETCESTPTKIDEIIRRVFTVCENQEDWPSELIVRPPHLIAKYGREVGRLLLGQQVPKLSDYYEKIVLPDCEVFIQNHFLIKPRNDVRLLNIISGIMTKIVETEIQFEKPANLEIFLTNQDKKILLVNTKSILLSSINIYQSLQKTTLSSSLESYLFFEFDHYNKQQVEVNRALYSKATDLLVVQYPTNSDEKKLINVLNILSELLSEKSNKKIIFITQECHLTYFKEALNKVNLSDSYVEQKEQQLTLNNLTSDSQKILLGKVIIFQGEKRDLSDIIHEHSKEFIGSEILDKLINNEETKIGNKLTISRDYDRDYYIDRTFNCQIQINSNVFKVKDNYDLLAVSGTNKSAISKLIVEGERIRLFEENDPNKNNPIKFIVLDNQKPEEEFKKLCKQHPTRNIHWLISDAAKFIWKDTRGSISHLIKYREENKDYDRAGNDTNLKEEDLVICDDQNKIVIISDTAGIGKSTVLTNLSMHVKNKLKNMWVVRVDLNDCSKALDLELQKRKCNNFSFNHDTNGNSAVDFFLNEMLESDENLRLKTSSEKELIKHSFKVQGNITVMFDGFDEICPTYKDIVLDLLQALRSTALYKLLVTSRPNVKQELEENLEVFSCTLEPFSEENQVEFLTKFWKKKLGLQYINQETKECLVKYAEDLIDKFCTSISDREKVFTGIPLQMKMVAEIFQENREETQDEWQGCKEFLDAYNVRKKPKLPESLDLLGLYEDFTKKKFIDIFLQEKQKLDLTRPCVNKTAKSYKEFKEKHELLAIHNLLNHENLVKLLSKEGIQNPQETIEDFQKIDEWIKDIKHCEDYQGFINKIIYEKANFIHLTFAEYFASFPLVERLFSKSSEKVKVVLKCIDSAIAKTSPVFINSIIKLLDKQKTETVRILEGRTLLNLVTQEGHLNFVKALFEAGYDNYPKPDRMNKTPLHYAAEYGHPNIVTFLLNYNNDILEDDILEHGIFKKEEYSQSKLVEFVNKQDRDGNTAVYYAAEKGNMDIACDLLLKGADSYALREYIITVTLFVTEKIRNFAYANQWHKLRPIEEKLLIQAPESVSQDCEYPRLLSYFFVHGRVHVIEVLLRSIQDEEKRKRNLNAADNNNTPLDRVNFSAKLRDDDRLAITKYLFENGCITTNHFVEWSSGSVDYSTMHITNILQASAKYGHMKTFEYFIGEENSNNYHLHLCTAFQYNQLAIIIFLLENHSQNIKQEGNTALHSAFYTGASLKIIKYLIENGEDVNAKNDLGKTPLFPAICLNRGLTAIKYLIDQGANVNIPDEESNTPLYYAIEADHRDTIKYLILKCEAEVGPIPELIKNKVAFFRNPNEFNLNFVDQMGGSNGSKDLEWSKFIIQQGGNVNSKDPEGRTPLHLASEHQQTEIVQLLLQHGAAYDDTDTNNKTPLDLASREGLDPDKNKICWLLKLLSELFNSKDLERDLRERLFKERGNKSKDWGPYDEYDNPAPFILNARNAKLRTLLHTAADTNDTDAMDTLLDFNRTCLKEKTNSQLEERSNRKEGIVDFQSISVNAIDHQGNTPLHLAAQRGYDKVVSRLLETGAIFNSKNNLGQTPETLATDNHHDNIVKLLQSTKNLFEAVKQNNLINVKNSINEGLYVDARDENGKTPLHFAAALGQSEIAKLLLKDGADIEGIDIRHRTPLHFAVECDMIEIVKLLLKERAIFNSRNKQDKAPFELENNRSVNLLVEIDKLFNDIQSATFEIIFDGLEIVMNEYDLDISTIINVRDNEENTMLHYAAYYPDIMKFLLENGVSFNAENKLRQTAKDLATHQEIINLLESIENMFKDVVINHEEENCNVQIITNVRDDQGMTLLHKAAESGKLKVVKWLVERGADINAGDKDGHKVQDLAKSKNQLEVMKYLKRISTDVNATSNEINRRREST